MLDPNLSELAEPEARPARSRRALGLVALAATGAFSAAAMAYAEPDDKHRQCVVAQRQLFLHGAYSQVPARIDAAANFWCQRHADRAGQPDFR